MGDKDQPFSLTQSKRDDSCSLSSLVTAKGFFTQDEKPFTFGDSLQRKGRDEPIVEGSTIGLALQRKDPSSPSGKRRVLLSLTFGEREEMSPPLDYSPSASSPKVISRSRREGSCSLEGAKNTLLLTSSKRDEPIVEGSTIRLVSQDPSFDWVKTKRDEPLSFLFKITPLGTVSGYSRGRKVEVESRQLSGVK